MLKKIITITTLAATTLTFNFANACSSIFINKDGYHIHARTMDFNIDIGDNHIMGYVGQKNQSNPVINAKNIPEESLATWTNKYGFFGRKGFSSTGVVSGMNTQGLTADVLYLPDITKYPEYNKDSPGPVLGINDIPAYVLSQASNVEEAFNLLFDIQPVNAAVKVSNGIYATDIPLHFIFRDKTGDTLILEFIDGNINYHKHAGNVVTNSPGYDMQLQNAKDYSSLLDHPNSKDPQFENKVINYNEIYKYGSATSSSRSLIGMPGDYSSMSRFVRGDLLLQLVPEIHDRDQALYQAEAIIDSLKKPFYEPSFTIWKDISDLDNLIIYSSDLVKLSSTNKAGPTFYNGKQDKIYNLNDMDFSTIPDNREYYTKKTPQDQVKKILPISKLREIALEQKKAALKKAKENSHFAELYVPNQDQVQN